MTRDAPACSVCGREGTTSSLSPDGSRSCYSCHDYSTPWCVRNGFDLYLSPKTQAAEPRLNEELEAMTEKLIDMIEWLSEFHPQVALQFVAQLGGHSTRVEDVAADMLRGAFGMR